MDLFTVWETSLETRCTFSEEESNLLGAFPADNLNALLNSFICHVHPQNKYYYYHHLHFVVWETQALGDWGHTARLLQSAFESWHWVSESLLHCLC